jgi:hypothetical protein
MPATRDSTSLGFTLHCAYEIIDPVNEIAVRAEFERIKAV